jgi:hypothetical protein
MSVYDDTCSIHNTISSYCSVVAERLEDDVLSQNETRGYVRQLEEKMKQVLAQLLQRCHPSAVGVALVGAISWC